MYGELFNAVLEDHNEIRDTMGRLVNMSDAPPIKKKALLAEFEFQLIPHMKAEESTFYAALTAKSASHEDTLKSIEEHRVARTMLSDLKNTPVGDDAWEPRMKVLNEFINLHFDCEEKDLFQDTDRVFSAEEINTIFMRFREEKDKAKARLP